MRYTQCYTLEDDGCRGVLNAVGSLAKREFLVMSYSTLSGEQTELDMAREKDVLFYRTWDHVNYFKANGDTHLNFSVPDWPTLLQDEKFYTGTVSSDTETFYGGTMRSTGWTKQIYSGNQKTWYDQTWGGVAEQISRPTYIEGWSVIPPSLNDVKIYDIMNGGWTSVDTLRDAGVAIHDCLLSTFGGNPYSVASLDLSGLVGYDYSGHYAGDLDKVPLYLPFYNVFKGYFGYDKLPDLSDQQYYTLIDWYPTASQLGTSEITIGMDWAYDPANVMMQTHRWGFCYKPDRDMGGSTQNLTTTPLEIIRQNVNVMEDLKHVFYDREWTAYAWMTLAWRHQHRIANSSLTYNQTGEWKVAEAGDTSYSGWVLHLSCEAIPTYSDSEWDEGKQEAQTGDICLSRTHREKLDYPTSWLADADYEARWGDVASVCMVIGTNELSVCIPDDWAADKGREYARLIQAMFPANGDFSKAYDLSVLSAAYLSDILSIDTQISTYTSELSTLEYDLFTIERGLSFQAFQNTYQNFYSGVQYYSIDDACNGVLYNAPYEEFYYNEQGNYNLVWPQCRNAISNVVQNHCGGVIPDDFRQVLEQDYLANFYSWWGLSSYYFSDYEKSDILTYLNNGVSYCRTTSYNYYGGYTEYDCSCAFRSSLFFTPYENDQYSWLIMSDPTYHQKQAEITEKEQQIFDAQWQRSERTRQFEEDYQEIEEREYPTEGLPSTDDVNRLQSHYASPRGGMTGPFPYQAIESEAREAATIPYTWLSGADWTQYMDLGGATTTWPMRQISGDVDLNASTLIFAQDEKETVDPETSAWTSQYGYGVYRDKNQDGLNAVTGYADWIYRHICDMGGYSNKSTWWGRGVFDFSQYELSMTEYTLSSTGTAFHGVITSFPELSTFWTIRTPYGSKTGLNIGVTTDGYSGDMASLFGGQHYASMQDTVVWVLRPGSTIPHPSSITPPFSGTGITCKINHTNQIMRGFVDNT